MYTNKYKYTYVHQQCTYTNKVYCLLYRNSDGKQNFYFESSGYENLVNRYFDFDSIYHIDDATMVSSVNYGQRDRVGHTAYNGNPIGTNADTNVFARRRLAWQLLHKTFIRIFKSVIGRLNAGNRKLDPCGRLLSAYVFLCTNTMQRLKHGPQTFTFVTLVPRSLKTNVRINSYILSFQAKHKIKYN